MSMNFYTFRGAPRFAALLATALFFSAAAQAQVREPEPVYRCELRSSPQPPLSIIDNASHRGALIGNPQLITLHNGMRAVTFSVTYADGFTSGGPRKLRYTVSWFDDCGRPVTLGSNAADGLVINPGQHVTRQSVAPTRDASIAEVRFYVEPSFVPDPYQQ